MVRQRVLVPSFAGSNPASLAIFLGVKNIHVVIYFLGVVVGMVVGDFLGAVGLFDDDEAGEGVGEDHF